MIALVSLGFVHNISVVFLKVVTLLKTSNSNTVLEIAQKFPVRTLATQFYSVC